MRAQARAPQTQPFGAEALEAGDGTVLRWLGMAGFLINSRGTTLMVDPLLGGFDMPVLIEFPIASAEVPRLIDEVPLVRARIRTGTSSARSLCAWSSSTASTSG